MTTALRTTTHMKRLAFFSLVVALLLTAACQSSGDKNTAADFSEPELLALSDSIAIDEILQPENWAVSQGKAVVFSRRTDSLFFVYRLPEFKYLYSFGRKGEGPDEFNYPYLRDGYLASDSFSVEDLSKKARIRYDLGDTSARKTETVPYHDYNILFPINDSILVQAATDMSSDHIKPYYRTIRPGGEAIDSIIPLVYTRSFRVEHFPNGGIGIRGRYFNDAKYLYKDHRWVILYADMRRMDIYEISAQGKITLVRSLGDASTYEQINAMDLENSPSGEAVYRVQGTPRHIYALTGDYVTKEKSRDIVRSYVEVYDWEGRPIKKFDLGGAFTHFLVDEAHEKIFCFHSGNDFECVFAYNYSL